MFGKTKNDKSGEITLIAIFNYQMGKEVKSFEQPSA